MEVARIRIEGTLLGTSLTALVAAAGNANGATWALGPLDLSLLGVGVGAVVGWRGAPRVAESDMPVPAAMWQGVEATALGVVAVIVLTLTAAMTGPGVLPVESFAFVLIVVVAGVVISLPITIPIALVATAALRSARYHRSAPLLAVAASVLLAVFFGVEPRPRPFPGPTPGAGGGVLLEWTVANRSGTSFELYVADPDPATASEGGWTQGIAPCFVTTGSSTEAADWRLALTSIPLDEQGLEDRWPPPSLADAGTVPGSHAIVWIDVAADGATSVTVGRRPLSYELTEDQCAGGPSADITTWP